MLHQYFTTITGRTVPKIIKMKTLKPLIASYRITFKPIHYRDPSKHKDYLLIIITTGSKTKLIKYDIENDMYKSFSETNQLIKYPITAMVSFVKANKLYLITSNCHLHRPENLFICNLNTGRWEILRDVLKTDHAFCITQSHIFNINDEIHIVYQNQNKTHHHYIFDSENTIVCQLLTV